jgi:organic hydroperoxide reductase OsmC/OhrA
VSEHRASIRWRKQTPDRDFLSGRYSREHTWTFDGGLTIAASPSPSVVPTPWSNPAHVDPEEAFVASIVSCHFLTFLFLASRRGFVVEAYEDDPVGVMERNDRGIPWVARVVLSPRITWGASTAHPSALEEEQLHHAAHEQCFISNSVKTAIVVERPAPAKP